MDVLVPERYFPLPVLQSALYNLTPKLRAEIQPPTGGTIALSLIPVEAGLGNGAAADLLQCELVSAAVAHQAWEDHRSLRNLFYRAAFSHQEPAEEVLALLEQERCGELVPLHPWGSGPVPEGAAEAMAEARSRGGLSVTIDEGVRSVSVVIGTDAYPWTIVLRALSRVLTVAAAAVQATNGPEITVRLQAEMDPHMLAEWFLSELRKVDAIQPALYPPAFAMADTNLPPSDTRFPAAPRAEDRATAPAEPGVWVTIPIHLAVYPEAVVQTALLTLGVDFEGEILACDVESLQVRLRSRELPLSAEAITAAFKRELLIASVQRRTRAEAADLADLFASSAISVSSGFQQLVRSVRAGARREEDNSPNIDPPESAPCADMPGCRVIFRDEHQGQAHYDLNPQRYALPEILHLAAVLRPQAQLSVIPGPTITEVYVSARDPANFATVEASFLGELRRVDMQPEAPV